MVRKVGKEKICGWIWFEVILIFVVIMSFLTTGSSSLVYAQSGEFTFLDVLKPSQSDFVPIPAEVLKGFLPPPAAGCKREEGYDFELGEAMGISEASIPSGMYIDAPYGEYAQIGISIADCGAYANNIPAFFLGRLGRYGDASKFQQINIKGYPARIRKISQEEHGEYNHAICHVVVCNRFDVGIEVVTTGAPWDLERAFKTVMGYANAINYDGLCALVSAKKDMKEGDQIVTKDRNVAVNLGKSSVMNVSKNSKVEVTKLSKNESSFKVIWGKVWAKIEKLGKGEKINFYGVTACTCIRGTEFVFEVEKDGTSSIIVIEGMVEFSDLGKKKLVIVKEKQRSIVKQGKLPSEPENIDLKKIIKWWE